MLFCRINNGRETSAHSPSWSKSDHAHYRKILWQMKCFCLRQAFRGKNTSTPMSTTQSEESRSLAGLAAIWDSWLVIMNSRYSKFWIACSIHSCICFRCTYRFVTVCKPDVSVPTISYLQSNFSCMRTKRKPLNLAKWRHRMNINNWNRLNDDEVFE